MRGGALLLAALLCLAAPLHAQRRADLAPSLAAADTVAAAERPPLSGGRVAAQVTTGVLGGVVGASAVAGGLVLATQGTGDGWEDLFAVVLGVMVGYPLGATGGVLLAGNTGGQTGSAWATLAGSAAGAGVGALLAAPTGGLSFVALVPIGAAAGFNLTRRYRSPPAAAVR